MLAGCKDKARIEAMGLPGDDQEAPFFLTSFRRSGEGGLKT